ncbi:S-methyl-5-thioribose-1-phosphate isomerase [Planosporangium mesophilum]|uniref:Methylthioribose-1-phosphate isomerase n=1 Tax=Planosporangium mesophilum TaxID=689768 RepID=A0A8J3X3G3_9ACTN|nr:S-methyl-5-thioribose-1-phosphate isomerase [Planosporangium mesophilum]NJC82564.1 S-methyl-5-thioribose-1-phosphate isomerase [Planosporangium mesophilum]GII26480.1 methylthioribose-1-phosphate isomerase [Planosporangium mesophilum]
MRTIDWVDGVVEIIDQTALPDVTRVLRLSTVEELVAAVRRLAVRGAPAIGVAGAFGVALAARQFAGDPDALAAAVDLVRTARPTAVNLARCVDRAAARLPEGSDAVLAEALRIRDEEVDSADRMGRLGADVVTSLCGERPRLLTHCNTGALATVTGGTALAVAFELHRRGVLAGMIASETRPLLQGARLTAWELDRAGIPYRVAVDGAGPFLMARGEVDAVILGADRICANGDVVNKVGTYAHALGARAAGIPFLVVAPESTVDLDTPSGDAVEIEDRGPAEVVSFHGVASVPAGADAVNPAFDVTPHSLVTAIVTDRRVIRLDKGETMGSYRSA